MNGCGRKETANWLERGRDVADARRRFSSSRRSFQSVCTIASRSCSPRVESCGDQSRSLLFATCGVTPSSHRIDKTRGILLSSGPTSASGC